MKGIVIAYRPVSGENFVSPSLIDSLFSQLPQISRDWQLFFNTTLQQQPVVDSYQYGDHQQLLANVVLIRKIMLKIDTG